jgi:hypothetical protein
MEPHSFDFKGMYGELDRVPLKTLIGNTAKHSFYIEAAVRNLTFKWDPLAHSLKVQVYINVRRMAVCRGEHITKDQQEDISRQFILDGIL